MYPLLYYGNTPGKTYRFNACIPFRNLLYNCKSCFSILQLELDNVDGRFTDTQLKIE